MYRRVMTTEQQLPQTMWGKLRGSTSMWEELITSKGNVITKKTKTFGRVHAVWYPNKKRGELLTITCHITVEWGYTFEENFALLLHGLAGLGYATVTGVFSTPRTLTITATKDNNMKQFSMPFEWVDSR